MMYPDCESSLRHVLHHRNLEVVCGDVRHYGLLRGLVKKSDVLVLLACLTGAPACDRDPHGAKSVIVDALEETLRWRSPGQRILYPTTNSGYGVGEKDKRCTEDSPLRPVSLYGRLKCQAERMVLESGNAVTFRLATAFGVSPRMRTDLLVNDFTARAVFDRAIVLFEGHFRRNFIHVRDVAVAFLHALNNWDGMKNACYNVGLSDANLTKRELAEEIKKQVPELVVFEADTMKDVDQRNYVVDNSRIERTGYKPQVSLQAGIAELIKFYRLARKYQHGNV